METGQLRGVVVVGRGGCCENLCGLGGPHLLGRGTRVILHVARSRRGSAVCVSGRGKKRSDFVRKGYSNKNNGYPIGFLLEVEIWDGEAIFHHFNYSDGRPLERIVISTVAFVYPLLPDLLAVYFIVTAPPN